VASPALLEIVTFGEFEAKLNSRELCRKGVRVRLPDQSFQILAMLLERRGELVTRDEIRQRLWPGDTFVDFDHGLNNAVNRLREALGDSAESPHFVETLPRRGYRFIAPVEVSGHSPVSSVPSASQSVPVPVKGSVPRKWAVAMAVTGVLLLAILTISPSHVRTPGAGQITSLAVLPLENVSGDPAQEYFADGMTDTLITNLAGLKSVRVISRTSAMHYKGSGKSLPEIVRELDVDAVVEGTVSKAGDRVRINAQLVDARQDRHLWARQYDSKLQDVLQLQSDLAFAIALEVSGKLTPNEASRIGSKRRQVDQEAYEAYLKGEYFLDKWTVDGFEKTKSYFERAIQIDPSFADAYAGLAEYYGTVAFMGIVPPREAWLKSEDLLVKTLAMDNTSSKAHSLLGMLKLTFRCDRSGAEKELNQAVELNPGDIRALDYHSYYLLETGRTDQAITEKRRVLEHDPLRVITNAELGLYLLQANRIDEAITQLQKTLELDPNYAPARARLGTAYASNQHYGEAVSELQKALSLDRNPNRLGLLGDVYARWGKRQEALNTIRQLQRISNQSYVAPNLIAVIYSRLGEKNAAIAWLEKANPENDPKISDPGFDSIRSDARFKALEARLRPEQSCPAF
jgi:TolB-like protein/DNA-binding winged helix-turn-helix (wHTH) protein/Flp pilus assembly protein TadD